MPGGAGRIPACVKQRGGCAVSRSAPRLMYERREWSRGLGRFTSRSRLRSLGFAPAGFRCFHRNGAPPLCRERGCARLTSFGSAHAPERRSVRILLPALLEGWHDAYQVGRPMTPGTIAHLGGPFDHFALPFADSALSDGESRLGRRGSPCHCCRRFYKSAGNSDTHRRATALWRGVCAQVHIGCDAKVCDTNSSSSLEFFGATTHLAPQVVASASRTASLQPDVTMAAISG